MTRAEELLILSGGRTKRSAGGSWIAWLEEFLEAEPEAVAETVRVIDVAGEPRPQGLRKALKRRHGGELLRGAPLPEPVPAGVRREAAALWTRTPPRAEPRDRTPYVAAVSDVVRFAACPLACRFRTVLGAEAWGPAGGDEPGASEPEGADDFLAAADARAWGNALHRLLETCDLDRGVTEAAAATAIGRELGREARAGEAAAAVAEVTRFLRSEAGVRARAAGGARVRRERPFLLRLEGVLLRGKIDLLVEPAGSGSWLVDYKSGAYAAERGARYRLQMLLYAEAVERITGARPERALLHFLADGRALEVPLTAAGRAEAAAVVRAFAAAHEADAFPAAPGPERCIPCEFQAACRFAIVRG
jgi:ATP-dependent exoDNAse (exonuclease V) beta subunit